MLQSALANSAAVPGTTAGTFTVGNDARIIGVSVDSPVFGVVPGSVSSAQRATNTAGIQAAWAAAAAGGKILFFGPYLYQINDTLNFGGGTNGQVYLRGFPGRTIIDSSSTTADILVIGNGTPPPGSLEHGEIHGIIVQGPSSTAPQNGQAGIKLNAMLGVRIAKCSAFNTDIGFDMINNCYKSQLVECRTGFGGSCNVGVNLRGAPNAGCGNQIAFYNCWTYGAVAGYHISSGVDGINIRDGQCGSGAGGLGADSNGGIIAGKDYLTGATGGSGVIMVDGVDFEGFSGWVVRGYSEMALTVRNCPIISYSDGTSQPMAQGVVKFTGGMNLSAAFYGNTVRGHFASPVAISYAGYGGSSLIEDGTRTDGAYFAGVATAWQSMFVQSALPTGIAQYHDYNLGDVLYIGGLMLRSNGSALQVSTDRATFNNLLLGGVKPSAVAGLSDWYSADRIIPAPADGGAVGSWADLSGSGGAATQATTADQPTYRSARSSIALPYSGAPVLQFDGVNDYLSLALSASTALSAVVVASASDFAAAVAALIGPNSLGGLCLRLQSNGSQLAVEASGSTGIGTAAVTLVAGEYYVFGVSYANPGAWVLTLNGKVVGSGTSTTTLTSSLTLQIGKDHTADYWKGGIAEVVLYNSAKAASGLVAVSLGLMQKYGIS